MEGIWYLLLILALYLLPELLKKLRQQQKSRYEYPPLPLPVEMAAKEEDPAETAKVEKEPMFTSASQPLPATSASKKLAVQTVVQGVIWAEILKPPLSKRRERWGRLRRN